MNYVYRLVAEGKDKDERAEFDAKLTMTWDDWLIEETERVAQEAIDRRRLVTSVGEVAT